MFACLGPVGNYVTCGPFDSCLVEIYLSQAFFQWSGLPHSVHRLFLSLSAATGHSLPHWLASAPSSQVQHGAGGGLRAPREETLPEDAKGHS